MNRAFTLIVLMLLFAVVALGCTSVPQDSSVNPYTNPTGAKDAALAGVCKANMRVIFSEEQVYETQNGSYATLDQLSKSTGRVPKEPAGGYYAVDTKTGAVICSKGHGSVSQ